MTTPDGALVLRTVVTRPPTPDLIDVHDGMPALPLSNDLATCMNDGLA